MVTGESLAYSSIQADATFAAWPMLPLSPHGHICHVGLEARGNRGKTVSVYSL